MVELRCSPTVLPSAELLPVAAVELDRGPVVEPELAPRWRDFSGMRVAASAAALR